MCMKENGSSKLILLKQQQVFGEEWFCSQEVLDFQLEEILYFCNFTKRVMWD